jgi:PAS domain S-box-containing protein
MDPEKGRGILSRLEQLPRWGRHLVIFGGLGALGVFDYLTGRNVSFGIFYLIPVSLAAGIGNTLYGLVAAAAGGLTWFVVEYLSLPTQPIGYPLWNAFVRLGTFLVVAVLISRLRYLNIGLESIVQRRTRELSQEVAERIRAEEKARETARRFQDLVENISEVFYISDTQGRVLYASPNFFLLGGYTPEEVIGRRYVRLIAPPDRRRVVEFYLRKAREGVQDVRCEFRTLLRNGSFVWVDQATRIVRDENGAVVEYRNVVRDISERKRAEERITLLAQALESSSDLVSIVDITERFTFVNRAFLEKYGYEEQEIVGRPVDILRGILHDPDMFEQMMAATRQGGWVGELYTRRKDGTEFPVFLSSSRIQDLEGAVIGYMLSARDITERKKAEEALRAAEERFEKILSALGHGGGGERSGQNQSKSIELDSLASKINALSDTMQEGIHHTLRFSSLASHELRTPLAIVRNQLEEGLDMKLSKEHLQQVIAAVYDEILRMTRIVDDLLSISAFEAGTFPLQSTEVELQKFLEEFYEEALYLSREKKISVVLAPIPPVVVKLDGVKMRQVFFNLLDNSLRNTPPHGRIRIAPSAENGRVVIRFSDTGRGIPPDHLEKLFDPFTRIESGMMTEGRGFGLGLPLVHKIIRAHGGNISVESVVNEGTTFVIELPLASSN